MKAKSGKYISFLPDHENIAAGQDAVSVLEVAIVEQIPLHHTCGGFGTCGTCRIYVRKGLENLPERNEIEAEIAADRGFAPYERLACQTEPIDGLVVEIPSSEIKD